MTLARINAVIPTKQESARYTELFGISQVLFDYTKYNTTTYKRTMAQLEVMINVAKAELNNTSIDGMCHVPMEPVRRRG